MVPWFSDGLSRYDGTTWKTYGVREGLLGADVYAIAIAENNDVWAGTKGGIVRLSVSPHLN